MSTTTPSPCRIGRSADDQRAVLGGNEAGPHTGSDDGRRHIPDLVPIRSGGKRRAHALQIDRDHTLLARPESYRVIGVHRFRTLLRSKDWRLRRSRVYDRRRETRIGRCDEDRTRAGVLEHDLDLPRAVLGPPNRRRYPHPKWPFRRRQGGVSLHARDRENGAHERSAQRGPRHVACDSTRTTLPSNATPVSIIPAPTPSSATSASCVGSIPRSERHSREPEDRERGRSSTACQLRSGAAPRAHPAHPRGAARPRRCATS